MSARFTSTPWSDFVQQVEDELAGTGDGYLPLNEAFARERDLTKAVALGLRRLFLDRYSVTEPFGVHHHVTFREGPDDEDREAWARAKPDKWVVVHGLRFVPDVLIRRTLEPVTDVLPIEVKLVTAAACSQSIATAIGQCFAYSVKYQRSVVFVGVRSGLTRGEYGLTDLRAQSGHEAAFRQKLMDNGICLVIREVGLLATATP